MYIAKKSIKLRFFVDCEIYKNLILLIFKAIWLDNVKIVIIKNFLLFLNNYNLTMYIVKKSIK